MQRIIAGAVRNGVALEISEREKLPSERFVRLGKAARARFIIGTNNRGRDDWGDWSYSMELQRKTGLSWQDLHVPGHAPTRSRQLWISAP